MKRFLKKEKKCGPSNSGILMIPIHYSKERNGEKMPLVDSIQPSFLS